MQSECSEHDGTSGACASYHPPPCARIHRRHPCFSSISQQVCHTISLQNFFVLFPFATSISPPLVYTKANDMDREKLWTVNSELSFLCVQACARLYHSVTACTQAHHHRAKTARELLLSTSRAPPRLLNAYYLAAWMLVNAPPPHPRPFPFPFSYFYHFLGGLWQVFLLDISNMSWSAHTLTRLEVRCRYTDSPTRSVRLLGQMSVMMFLLTVGSFLIISFNIWDRTGRFPWDQH